MKKQEGERFKPQAAISIMRWLLIFRTVRLGIFKGQDTVMGGGQFALELFDFLPLAIDHLAQLMDRLFLLHEFEFQIGEALVGHARVRTH